MFTSLYFYRVPKKNVDAFLLVQKKSAEIYKKHGAIDDWTFAPSDLGVKYGCASLLSEITVSADDQLFFSLSLFKSKADHDQTMAAVDRDPEIEILFDEISSLIEIPKVMRGEFNRLV